MASSQQSWTPAAGFLLPCGKSNNSQQLLFLVSLIFRRALRLHSIMTNKAPGYLEKMINAEKRALPSLDERPLPNLLRSFCSCSPLPAYPSIPLSWRIAPALFSDKSLWTLHLHTHVAAGKWGTDYRIGRALGHLSAQGQRQFLWWSGLHEPRGAQIPDLVRMLRRQSQKIRGCVSCLKRHCQKDRIP